MGEQDAWRQPLASCHADMSARENNAVCADAFPFRAFDSVLFSASLELLLFLKRTMLNTNPQCF
jgi:hypothetical protein